MKKEERCPRVSSKLQHGMFKKVKLVSLLRKSCLVQIGNDKNTGRTGLITTLTRIYRVESTIQDVKA